MRTNPFSTALALILTGFMGYALSAVSLGRQYQFGFENGNLIRNWSFENLGDYWFDETNASTHFLAKRDNITAVSGSYVAKYSGSNTGTATTNAFIGDPFPIEANATYTFSYYVKTSGNTANVQPFIWFYSSRDIYSTYLGTGAGVAYPVNADWTFYSYSFTTPDKTYFARFSLMQLLSGQGGTFYFDDLILEKGSAPTSRTAVRELVGFTNDLGQMVQSWSKVAGGGSNQATRDYLVKANDYDAKRRLTRSYSIYPRSSSPNFDPAYFTHSLEYEPPGKEGMGFANSPKVEYWDEPGDPVSAVYLAGMAWGAKSVKSGSYYVDSFTAPANPEAEPSDDAERKYLFSWSKDEEDRYSLSWTNRRGEVEQVAAKLNTSWAYNRYEYFPDGNLKKILTPLDVPGNEASQEFRQVINYNSLGEVTSIYTKDKGLRTFWRDRYGKLRFARHESQPAGQFDYTDYDFLDRPMAMGTQILSPFAASMADDRSTASTVKSEQRGILYDDLANFTARTGLALSDIIPGKTLGVNGEGRVVCTYNFNRDVALSALAAKDKFVATFYNYNAKGEVTDIFKYIGPIKDPVKRIHKVVLTRDGRHRISGVVLQDNQASPATLLSETYKFDELGRVIAIAKANGESLAKYEFHPWGGLKSVHLGGTTNTVLKGTHIEYTYNSQGWVSEAKATRQETGEIFYDQFLGYDGKAINAASIPAPLQGKFDGSISQQVYRFANDIKPLGPVRAVNYLYDEADRMLVADGRKNSNAEPLPSASGPIDYAALQFTDTQDMDSRMSYDPVGRILTNQSGVATADRATYRYQTNSYKLDGVTGKLSDRSNRDASKAGNFSYDGRGRMTGDLSKKLTIRYGWDEMPLEFVMDMGDSLVSDFNFYDFEGTRVSRVHAQTKVKQFVPIFMGDIALIVKAPVPAAAISAKPVASISDVNILADGDRRWEEQYNATGALATSSGRTGVFGVTAQIGEILPNGSYRYFVKNAQGSTMRSVGENGEFQNAESNTLDYLAYGESRALKQGSTGDVLRKFVGKEFEQTTGLYAMGARWMDPQLGSFITPDPMAQYANPYSYTGGNPINRTDPTGLSDVTGHPPILEDVNIKGKGDYPETPNAPTLTFGGFAQNTFGRNGTPLYTSRQIEGVDPIKLDNSPDSRVYGGPEVMDFNEMAEMMAMLQLLAEALDVADNAPIPTVTMTTDKHSTSTPTLAPISGKDVDQIADASLKNFAATIGNFSGTGLASKAYRGLRTIGSKTIGKAVAAMLKEGGKAAKGTGRLFLGASGAAEGAFEGATASTRAFWVGEDGFAAARASGSEVLRLTPQAESMLNAGNPGLMFEESAAWAKGATGTAKGFIGTGSGYTFYNYELPQLLKNMDNGTLQMIEISY
jgi:RHS repeat-associated protein